MSSTIGSENKQTNENPPKPPQQIFSLYVQKQCEQVERFSYIFVKHMFGINKTSNIQTLGYQKKKTNPAPKLYCHLIVNAKFRQSLSEVVQFI